MEYTKLVLRTLHFLQQIWENSSTFIHNWSNIHSDVKLINDNFVLTQSAPRTRWSRKISPKQNTFNFWDENMCRVCMFVIWEPWPKLNRMEPFKTLVFGQYFIKIDIFNLEANFSAHVSGRGSKKKLNNFLAIPGDSKHFSYYKKIPKSYFFVT